MDTNARVKELIQQGYTQGEAFAKALEEKVIWLEQNMAGFRRNK